MEIVHMSKIMKVGTSHAMVIPVNVMEALGIKRGDYMVFAVYGENTFAARKMDDEEVRALKPLPDIKSTPKHND